MFKSYPGCAGLFVCTVGLFITGQSAFADTYVLNIDHCTDTCGISPPNYGTVNVTQDGSAVDILVTLGSNVRFVSTGASDALGFNIAGDPAITISALTSGFSQGSGGHFDGFGTFMYSIVCDACGSGGSNPQPGPLSFTVSRTGGGSLSISDFQTLSSGGSPSVYFDADVIGPNGKTGPVGANTFTPSVPEPSAIALFATGLIGAALSIRRRSMFSK